MASKISEKNEKSIPTSKDVPRDYKDHQSLIWVPKRPALRVMTQKITEKYAKTLLGPSYEFFVVLAALKIQLLTSISALKTDYSVSFGTSSEITHYYFISPNIS